MTRTFSRPILVALAALLALAVCRVEAAPGPQSPYGGYTWQSAFDEARFELDATVTGVQREILEAKATYTGAWQDIQRLQDTLTSVTYPR